ncbi:predicted protein [Naegleria gruberi]|uniref:Predicted protein n=1 Tax=Naegleria gruberi TaxID=5762 RepID=D2V6F7_NAEGR|nr:uncharacterized protein NAEGRDRAFT_64419 [Naegleria gruberi]EFC47438.1 predicted protein [Naegleria gruberi]|eukprot:XP_002680182.1 predicted protein [Naegleria gruberi strain NEG-M]
MKIQILSDLHIEHFPSLSDFQAQYKNRYGNYLCETVYGEVLILAGDIGDPFQQSYFDFMQYCSGKYKAVMVIAGNHEFYGHEYFQTIDQIRNLTRSFSNVYFLNRDVVELTIDGSSLVFLGCTLWSHVPDKALNVVQNVSEIISIINTESITSQ